MAHTYVINAPVQIGDDLFISGSVDGTPVAVHTYVSAAGNSLASAIGFRNFAAALMLAALPTTSTALSSLAQTFTQ